jgi:hypothetical protein
MTKSPEGTDNFSQPEAMKDLITDLSKQAFGLMRYMTWPGNDEGHECRKLIESAFVFSGKAEPVGYGQPVLVSVDTEKLKAVGDLLKIEQPRFKDRLEILESVLAQAPVVSSVGYQSVLEKVISDEEEKTRREQDKSRHQAEMYIPEEENEDSKKKPN